MTKMKKIAWGAAALIALVLLGVLGGGAYLVRSINTPQFKKKALARIASAIGTDVQVREVNVSLLSGVTLSGVTVANPRPFRGVLLTADSLVLRYRLLSLLKGHVEVERLVIEKPRLNLAMDARGSFNYEKLGGKSTAAEATQSSKSSGPAVASPIVLVLRKLAVDEASIATRDQARALLMKVEDASLSTSFSVTAAGAEGKGRAKIATLNLADMMLVRDLSAPITMSGQSVSLAPIRGRLADGNVSGDVKVDLRGGFRFTSHLEAKNVAVATLLDEAHMRPTASGRLKTKASFEGSGGLPTITGGGQAAIDDCKLKDVKVLLLLSKVLNIPEVANPDFDQCLIDYRLASSRLRTPRLLLTGKQIQLTGQGTVNLDASTLDYDMTLALSQPLYRKITSGQIRSAFKDRGDGFATIDFKVYGSTLEPQTDLMTRVAKSTLAGAARSGLGKLFGKK
jgi:hypothetical protein